MFPKLFLICIIFNYLVNFSLAAESTTITGEEAVVDKLDVTVYYESLCSDSLRFVWRQLYPTWIQRREFMNLTLIPYGKAIQNQNRTTGEWKIECQHGPAECQRNKLHACVLKQLKFDEAFPLIACALRGFRSTIEECATVYGKNYTAIEYCANSAEGINLLVDYGIQTRKIDLNFVPSIEIDNIFNYDEQTDILYRFDQTFSRKYYEKFEKQPDLLET